MADVKISALPAVVTAATTDIFAIVQGGVTYKATLTQVVAAITSTGLTATAGALTVNLSTGVAGGQSVIGGTAASNSLTLSSTTNATKGKILFGTSAYDEVNNRLGIGTASPGYPLVITVGDTATAGISRGVHYNQTLTASANNDTLIGIDVSPTFTLGAFTGVTTIAQRFIANTNTLFRGIEIRNQSNGTSAISQFSVANDTGNLGIQVLSSGYTSSGINQANSAVIRSNSNLTNGLAFATGAFSSSPISFYTQDVLAMRLFSTNNLLIQNGGTFTDAGFRLDVNGTARIQERLTVSQDNTVATQVVSVITTDTANCGMVLQPTGTGAIMAQVPDGTATGGNARGSRAVDFQLERVSASQVASGSKSFIAGGTANSATNTDSFASGYGNNVTGTACFGLGADSTAGGDGCGTIGGNNQTSGSYNIAMGFRSWSSFRGQVARASGSFANRSDAQSSTINLRRSITGTVQTELFIDGSSERLILPIVSPGPTNARAWRAQIDLVAIVQTVGNGTVVLGECFMGSYHVGIKRIGTATSLVGAVSVTNEVSDTNMATAVTTITADDTNEALKIEFTPPTAAGSTTVIRVVATAYLTEVGY